MFFIFRNYNQEILDRLDSLEDNVFYLYERTKKKINSLIEKEERMSLSLEMLTREVAEQVEVTKAAIVLIEGIAAKLKEAGTDEGKLAELAATLDASQADLAAAVAENTDAEVPASTGEFAE